MKKILIWMCLVLLLAAAVQASPTLRNSNLNDSIVLINLNSDGRGEGAFFTANGTYAINTVEFDLGSISGPVDLQVALFDDNGAGGRPGTKLAIINQTSVNTGAKYNFTDNTNSTIVQDGETYWIILMRNGSGTAQVKGGGIAEAWDSTTLDFGSSWTAPANFVSYHNIWGVNATSSSNVTFIINDFTDDASINNIQINVTDENGSVDTYTNNTGNRITTDIEVGTGFLYNLSIGGVDYLSRNFDNQNFTSGLEVYKLYQAEVRFNASELLTNNPISANFTINGSTNTNGTPFYLRQGNYTVTTSSNGFISRTDEVNISVLQNNTIEIQNVSSAVINITVFNIATASSVNNFTATVENTSLGLNFTQSTTGGWVSLPVLINKTYNIIVTGDFSTNTTNLLATSNVTNYVAQVYLPQTVVFRLFDEVTQLPINATEMKVEVIGVTTQENTTTTGNLSLSLFTPGAYTVRWFSTDLSTYQVRSQYFSITPSSFQTLDLYSLNETDPAVNAVNVVFTVFDENLQRLDDAEITVKRFYTSANGYIPIASGVTDSAGEFNFKLQDVNAFYQYLATYNGEVRFVSPENGSQFVDTDSDGVVSKPIFINTFDSFFDAKELIDGVQLASSLTFTNTSNYTGYYTFTSVNNVTYEYCLEVRRTDTSLTEINTSCQTTTSPTIIIPVNTGGANRPGSWVATATFRTTANGFTPVKSLPQTLNYVRDGTQSEWIDNAVFVAFSLAAVALTFADLPIFVMFFLGSLVIGLGVIQLNITNITLGVGILIMLGGFVIAYAMRRRA